MKLYLMQHAHAYSSEENPERPLSPTGIEQAKHAARGCRDLKLCFDLIITSPKRRAHQTAALVAEGVRYPYSDILSTESVLPDRAPDALLETLQKERNDSHILIVGHLPFLGELAHRLMRGGELTFENAGLTCLELTAPDAAKLEFHLLRHHLSR